MHFNQWFSKYLVTRESTISRENLDTVAVMSLVKLNGKYRKINLVILKITVNKRN